MITNESLTSALSGVTDKPQKCTTCHKSHPEKCQKTKTAAVVHGADKICPVCSKQAHKYKTKLGTEGILKRIKDCPGFKTVWMIRNRKWLRS